jgi:hypothetical protein
VAVVRHLEGGTQTAFVKGLQQVTERLAQASAIESGAPASFGAPVSTFGASLSTYGVLVGRFLIHQFLYTLFLNARDSTASSSVS